MAMIVICLGMLAIFANVQRSRHDAVEDREEDLATDALRASHLSARPISSALPDRRGSGVKEEPVPLRGRGGRLKRP